MIPVISPGKSPTSRLTLAHLVIGGALVFVASNLLFAMNLRLAPSAIVGAGCLGAGFIIIRTASQNSFLATPVHVPFFALCMGAGFALCLLGGQGHIFYATHDWLIRDAVLADMSASALPAYEWSGQTWFLRAPLGMYLLPGALGRLGGLGLAHIGMLVQNACLTGCVLYLLAEAFERRTLGFLAIFVFFSGLDCLGYLRLVGIDVLPPLHLEGWNPLFQYSSFVTQLFWVPNHGLPGWWFAALLALHLRAGGLAPILLVFFAAAVLWSPLTMMGALPFVLFILLREARKMFSPAIIQAGVAGLAFLPVAAYLQADAARIGSRWMLGEEHFGSLYLLFITIEIPHVVFLATPAFSQRRNWSGGLVLAILLLLLIPFYNLGVFNDFVMRASIVPLTILGACFAVRTLELTQLKDPICFAAWTIIAIGALTPLTELVRNMRAPAYAISPCDLVSSWRELSGSAEGNLDHYMVHATHTPEWLLAPPQAVIPRLRKAQSCWPDHPAFRSGAN